MKRLLAIGSALLMIFSCTLIDTRTTLNDVESYIMERPDSALAVLESIDRKDLKTSSIRAHHALLHAMALDKNYIDVTDDSIASVAVDYYLKHGSKKNRARALYYLGKSYYYSQQYDKAILEYSKAERVAVECDSLYLGMIKTAKAGIYNRTYNSIEELKYTYEALKIFKAIGAERYYRPISYSLGMAYHNVDNYIDALSVYSDLINSSSEIDYYSIRATISSAHSMIEMDDVDYYVVDSLFRKAKYEYYADFEEKDYWAWAYSLYRIGREAEADEIVGKIDVADEFIASFWQFRIAVYLKDYKSVHEHNRKAVNRQNEIVEKILEESLATYQRDYYQSQLDLAEYKVRTRTMELLALIVLIILVSVILYLSIIRFIMRQKEEKERLFEYAEEIKRQLAESEKNNYPELKRKYLSLYKIRFEAIGTLCDQYLQASGRTDIESLMFRKVETLINEVRNDAANRTAFETMLDNDLDMIMTRLRTEMPKMKELDYSIFSYLIVGFDATTISRLLDMSVNNVYAHKRRIRIKIEEKQPEHSDQFLEMLV